MKINLSIVTKIVTWVFIVIFSFIVLASTVFLPFARTQYLLLRFQYTGRENMNLKIKAYQDFLKKYPYFIPARLKLASMYELRGFANPRKPGFFDLAMEQYNIILKIKTDYSEAMLGLADVYLDKEDYKEAGKLYTKLIKIYPESSDYKLRLAINYYNQKRYEEAKKEIKTILSKEPAFARAHLMLGKLYEQEGNLADSIFEYKNALELFQALKQTSNEVETRFGLGRVYFDSMLYFDAVQQFEKIIQYRPNMVEGYLGLGKIYYQLGLFDKSIEVVNELLKISLNIPNAHKLLGLVYFAKKDYVASYAYFKKAEALKAKVDPWFLEQLRILAQRQIRR